MNNPLKYTDPSGYWFLKKIIGLFKRKNKAENQTTYENETIEKDQGGGYGVPSGSGFQGPDLPYMLGEVTITAKEPVKNTPTAPIIDNNDNPFSDRTGLSEGERGHIISVVNGAAAYGAGGMFDIGGVVDSKGAAKMYFTIGFTAGFGATAGVGYMPTNGFYH